MWRGREGAVLAALLGAGKREKKGKEKVKQKKKMEPTNESQHWKTLRMRAW